MTIVRWLPILNRRMLMVILSATCAITVSLRLTLGNTMRVEMVSETSVPLSVARRL
jgi:hypothetical protein